MRHRSINFVSMLLLGLVSFLFSSKAQSADIDGSSDYPLIGRYEGSQITGYEQITFDKVPFIIAPVKRMKELNTENTMAVSGKRTIIVYQGPQERSSLEVMANFQQKMAAAGFKQLFQCFQNECGGNGGGALWSSFMERRLKTVSMKPRWGEGRYGVFELNRAEGDVFAAIYTQETDAGIQTRVDVVEISTMETDKIVVLSASELKAALDANGKVALYGIYFDTDEAELRPDSNPQLEAIALFLKESAGTEVIIAGHTDNQGGFDYNVDLSTRRAEAVLAALLKQGVSKDTLKAFGAGMAAPVSTNETDTGRAQNRRVEIVRR